jgi:hypothetical protein
MGRRTTLSAMAGASFLIGAATLIKPVYPLFAIVPLMRIFDAENRGRRVLLCIAALVGGALPLGAGLAVYAGDGHLDALWDVLVRFDFGSHLAAQHLSFRELAATAARTMVANRLSAPALFLAAIGLASLRRQNARLARLVLAGVAAGAACALVQGKFYLYQRLPFFDQIAILAGFGFMTATDCFTRSVSNGRRFPPPAAAGALVLAIPGMLLVNPVRTTLAWLSHDAGQLGDKAYIERFTDTDFSTADMRAAAELVDRTTAPGESIYLWGFDALVYFLADRPSASRFGYNYPMVVGSPEYIERSRRELLATLDRSPPRMILVEDHDENNLMPKSSRAYLQEFPELLGFIAARYAPAGGNPHFIAYVRR